MDPLTFEELRKANIARTKKSFDLHVDEWNAAEWGVALAGEVGELCNFIKKLRRDEAADTVDIDTDIAHEIADVAIYLDLLAAHFGLDLGEVVRTKFNITSFKRDCDICLHK